MQSLTVEGTISYINDWMSANFLSPNSDKTEFLLIGHPKQPSKLDHPTILFLQTTQLLTVYHQQIKCQALFLIINRT